MDRSNHYESAFEAYLRARGLCYIAIDETRRSLLDDGPVKSLDFIVYTPVSKLLVDVKGRKFPGGNLERPRMVWECWAEVDDVTGLGRWAERFGPEYTSLLVFVYDLCDWIDLPPETPDQWDWHGRRYLLRAVPITEYRAQMKVRSPKWRTVDLPRHAFRDMVRPFCSF